MAGGTKTHDRGAAAGNPRLALQLVAAADIAALDAVADDRPWASAAYAAWLDAVTGRYDSIDALAGESARRDRLVAAGPS